MLEGQALNGVARSAGFKKWQDTDLTTLIA
jgi:hypothetical protein